MSERRGEAPEAEQPVWQGADQPVWQGAEQPVWQGADRPGGRAGERPWTRPTLTDLGHLRDLVRGGGGKLSAQFDGDGRKPPGSG